MKELSQVPFRFPNKTSSNSYKYLEHKLETKSFPSDSSDMGLLEYFELTDYSAAEKEFKKYRNGLIDTFVMQK